MRTTYSAAPDLENYDRVAIVVWRQKYGIQTVFWPMHLAPRAKPVQPPEVSFLVRKKDER